MQSMTGQCFSDQQLIASDQSLGSEWIDTQNDVNFDLSMTSQLI